MGIGLRRNARRALFASVLCALAGCAGQDATPAAPEAAFRAFRGALRAAGADMPAPAWSMLGPATRARLEQRAADARAAGIDVSGPEALLWVGWVAGSTDLAEVARAEQGGDPDVVPLRVVTQHGTEFVVTAVRVDGKWYFELPAPEDADG
jgi:hypothetical protein